MRTESIQSPLVGSFKTESPLQQKPQKKTSFADDFKKTLAEIDNRQKEADNAMEKAADGGAEKIHETMIKLEEAGISMRMLLKVRTKALEAYQEVMRMQF
jgi:flagellar hook-basal body complex protein FliE